MLCIVNENLFHSLIHFISFLFFLVNTQTKRDGDAFENIFFPFFSLLLLLLLFCHISINYTHTDKYTYGRQIFSFIQFGEKICFFFIFLFCLRYSWWRWWVFDMTYVWWRPKKNWSYVVTIVVVVVVNQVKVNEFENFFFRRGKTEKENFFLSNSNCTLNEQEMKRKKWSKPKLWSIIYRIVFCFLFFLFHSLFRKYTSIDDVGHNYNDDDDDDDRMWWTKEISFFFCHLKIPKNSGYHHDHLSMIMHLIFLAVYSILSYRWKDKHLIVHR